MIYVSDVKYADVGHEYNPSYGMAVDICRRLHEKGFEAYLVGGCVRDMLLGRKPHDYDVCTSATPDAVMDMFADEDWSSFPSGAKYGTVSVARRKIRLPAIEVTTFRGETPENYRDGRHPEGVRFSHELEEDLRRRDFTVNAIVFDVATGEFKSLGPEAFDDIRAKTIRCVGEPYERFGEDTLRMLRAVRFCSTLGFHLHGDTATGILSRADDIRNVSAERIRDELTKILVGPNPDYLALASHLGLTQTILPEFDAVMTCEQRNKWHRMPLAEHTFLVVRGVRPDPVMRWAAFLHDFGKPCCLVTGSDGNDHFYGHATESAEIAERVCSRLKFDSDSKDRIVKLCLLHDEGSMGHITPRSARRIIAKVGEEAMPDWIELRAADIAAHSPYGMIESLCDLSYLQDVYAQSVHEGSPFDLKGLAVGGGDVMEELGVGPGPIVGKALQYLLAPALDDPALNERDILLQKLRQWYEEEKR
jgi:tRNA nucleotidyltransferase (CCA-adding enzyme)